MIYNVQKAGLVKLCSLKKCRNLPGKSNYQQSGEICYSFLSRKSFVFNFLFLSWRYFDYSEIGLFFEKPIISVFKYKIYDVS